MAKRAYMLWGTCYIPLSLCWSGTEYFLSRTSSFAIGHVRLLLRQHHLHLLGTEMCCIECVTRRKFYLTVIRNVKLASMPISNSCRCHLAAVFASRNHSMAVDTAWGNGNIVSLLCIVHTNKKWSLHSFESATASWRHLLFFESLYFCI